MIAKIIDQQKETDPNTGALTGLLLSILVVHEGYDESSAMSITGYSTGNPTLITCPNHMCIAGDYCGVENILPDGVIPAQFQVLSVIDENTISIDLDTTGKQDYSSGGEIFMAGTSNHGYRLNDAEIAAVNADQSGTNEALKGIAAAYANRVQSALLAQAQSQVNKSEDSSVIDLSSLLGIVVALLLVALVIWGISNYHTVKARKSIRQFHCADFNTQSDAQRVFNAGAKYLDANNDGIACNELLKK
jgi:hypothetical protein